MNNVFTHVSATMNVLTCVYMYVCCIIVYIVDVPPGYVNMRVRPCVCGQRVHYSFFMLATFKTRAI